MAKLLLVEDDRNLCADIKQWLEAENYVIEVANDGQSAAQLLKVYQYDLLILDWELPGAEQGIDVLRIYRQQKGQAPVIMLTGRAKIENKQEGFDSGADDYLTKPFELRELSVRLRSLLRRPPQLSENVLRIGALTVDPQTKTVTFSGNEIPLLPKEFALLEFLARHPNESFNSNALLNSVWTSQSEASVNTVKSFVYTLRKKLAAAGVPDLIVTSAGYGYKLVSEQDPRH
jgi:two-component system, OmpR family, response regulator